LFIISLHQFVHEALRDIARLKFEHQIIDNLSGFLEEFCNRSDIENLKRRFDGALVKANTNIKNQIDINNEFKNDDEANADHAQSTVMDKEENNANQPETETKRSITWYIIIIGIILLAIIIVIAIVIYMGKSKAPDAASRRLLDTITSLDLKIGRKLLSSKVETINQRLSNRLVI